MGHCDRRHLNPSLGARASLSDAIAEDGKATRSLLEWVVDVNLATPTYDAYRFALLMKAIGREGPLPRADVHELAAHILNISVEDVERAEADAAEAGCLS